MGAKLSAGQNHNRNRRYPFRRLKQIKIERRQIPDGRKTTKIIVFGFHFAVREIQRAADYHDNAGRNRKTLRQQPARGNRIGRDKYISGEIDHQVERIALTSAAKASARRMRGPSARQTPSTTSARPRQRNIAAQCPPVARIIASNASAAPVAVNM